jgi:hypothetical protein
VENNLSLSLVTLHRNYDSKYHIMIATSSLFLGIVLVTMISGPAIIPTTNGLTMDEISACRQNIIGSEQMGFYSSPEQFRAAESFCEIEEIFSSSFLFYFILFHPVSLQT